MKKLPTTLQLDDGDAETVVVRDAVMALFPVVAAVVAAAANSAVACCTKHPTDCNRLRQRQFVATFVSVVVSVVS
jgi:hypothetical protein